ncbi:MAG TPA: hypothetical protein VEA63_10795, partial [Opitutus sp.]|nr:hypothetical protein [Opitutus sp.]
MPRRREVPKRQILPDPKFNNVDVAKFVNVLMTRGKKSVAERIVYGALEILEKKGANQNFEGDEAIDTNANKGMLLFHRALKKVKPKLEVRSRRVGGATYQVPVEVRPERAQALAIRWLISASRSRSEKTMAGRLSGE